MKFLLIVSALLFFPALQAGAEETIATPQLSVSGDAELQVAADQMRLSVGVVTQGASAEAALQENSVRLQKVKNALQKEGLTDQEMETGQFRLEPLWSSPPRQPPADWQPKIVGYRAVNSLKLRTTRLEGAGRMIAAAAEAGANEIGSLSFDLADPRRHRAEAIRQATANARSDALALAEAGGVQVVRVLLLSLDQAAAEPMPRMYAMARESADAAPPILPGEVTVRATVRMIYEVAPAGTEKQEEQ